ncbi:MAG: tRNA lysidine(34) synthetase TilS [Gammaproteobacteria bacterium]
MKTHLTFETFRAHLSKILKNLASSRIVVAYSGGLDSSVLLDLVVSYVRECKNISLSLIHVDHGLSPSSLEWGIHCKEIASLYNLKCSVVRVTSLRKAKQSEEAWARNARYEILERHVDANSILLTAHHKNDQVETIIHHAMSGAGPHGLKGMRHVRSFGQGSLVRPLLNFSAEFIKEYALEKKLKWVEDSSNFSDKYLRNNIRKTGLPALEKIYPSALEGIYRVGLRQLEIVDGLNQIFDPKIKECVISEGIYSVKIFKFFPESLHGFLVKRLLEQIDFPVPRESHVLAILGILNSTGKRSPVVRWGGVEVRLYRSQMYLMRELPVSTCPSLGWTGLSVSMPWGELEVEKNTGREVLDPNKISHQPIKICFRRGGEKFQPSRSAFHHDLKKLFQQWNVPPWERAFVPIIKNGDEIVAVCGYGISRKYLAEEGEVGFSFNLRLSIYEQDIKVS